MQNLYIDLEKSLFFLSRLQREERLLEKVFIRQNN